MGEEFPWYKSAILQAQLVGAIMAVAAALKLTLGFDVNATVSAVFAVIGVAVPIYTAFRRLRSPAPNLTEAANKEEIRLVAEGKIPPSLASAAVVIKDQQPIPQGAPPS